MSLCCAFDLLGTAFLERILRVGGAFEHPDPRMFPGEGREESQDDETGKREARSGHDRLTGSE